MTIDLGPRVRFREEPKPLASVIIIAFRRAPLLLECLRALERSVREIPYEVLLVLNQPHRELVDLVERNVSGAKVIRTRVNLGFGGAVNLAADQARGEFVVLLNDDTEVLSDWLEKLVETARRRPQAGAVGSTMLFPDGSIQEAASVIWRDGSTMTVGRRLPGASRLFDYERRVDFSSGGSLLIRRDLFERLGGLDTRYFPAYYEDTDLCLRLAELGHETWYQPRSKVMHHESMSTNETFRSFLFARNKTIFADRWSELLKEREAAEPWDPAAVQRAVWRAMGSPQRVLLIDDQLADSAIGSGYPRMADTYRMITASGRYHLSAFTSLIDGGRNNDLVAELGASLIEGFTPDDLEDHLSSVAIPYDAVIISRPHNFERFVDQIRSSHPPMPIIYDAEALFHRRIERQAALGYPGPLLEEAAAMKALEGRIAAESDAIVTVSEEEAAFMRQHTDAPVHVHSPLLLGVRTGDAGFAERHDIAFIAGWAWGVLTPNVDALAWFARDVLPRVVARVPGARLLVTGSNVPDAALRLRSPSVEFTGRVADLAAFYGEVRVVVVPMRYGAGVKNKTVEALQFGVPTVSTSVGAEGLVLEEPGCLLVEDDPARFADRVAELLSSPRAWEFQHARLVSQHAHWERQEPSTVWPGVIDDAIAARRARPLVRSR